MGSRASDEFLTLTGGTDTLLDLPILDSITRVLVIVRIIFDIAARIAGWFRHKRL